MSFKKRFIAMANHIGITIPMYEYTNKIFDEKLYSSDLTIYAYKHPNETMTPKCNEGIMSQWWKDSMQHYHDTVNELFIEGYLQYTDKYICFTEFVQDEIEMAGYEITVSGIQDLEERGASLEVRKQIFKKIQNGCCVMSSGTQNNS